MKTFTKILGSPGTGKTARLMDIMDQEFKSGCRPDRMVFCSFTKKSIEEAINRATDRFNFTNNDMVYFKTIHGLAFHALGLKRSNVMSGKDYKKIGEHLGLNFSSKVDMADAVPGAKYNGDKYIFIDSYSRAKCVSQLAVWDNIDCEGLNWYEFQRFIHTVTEYKKQYNLVDFADMLEVTEMTLDVDVVIIDEAQDLSTAQWLFIEKFTRNAKRVYIAGDDDQAIYGWSGADVDYFINAKGTVEQLIQSYRIPKVVHTLAEQITSKIKHRPNKSYLPRESNGVIEYWNDVDHLDMTSGSWLLLARNSYLLCELARSARQRGIPYGIRGKIAVGSEHVSAIKLWEQWRKGKELNEVEKVIVQQFLPSTDWPNTVWHEALTLIPIDEREYYVSLLRRGESLTKNPRININTIHGVKGGEADHVVMLTDMAYSTWDATAKDPDSEQRVWYVGVTRCKESLNIILPRGRYNYNL